MAGVRKIRTASETSKNSRVASKMVARVCDAVCSARASQPAHSILQLLREGDHPTLGESNHAQHATREALRP